MTSLTDFCLHTVYLLNSLPRQDGCMHTVYDVLIVRASPDHRLELPHHATAN
jgi:hypothetical protein